MISTYVPLCYALRGSPMTPYTGLLMYFPLTARKHHLFHTPLLLDQLPTPLPLPVISNPFPRPISAAYSLRTLRRRACQAH
jgi:hypothetical protein